MKIKILVIEDEAIVALDITSKLESNGYEVVGIADNGAEALKIAQEKQPDIALVDISIKGNMNGIETARELNKSVQIPIIYVTALSDKTTLHNAAQTMPHAYLVKPFREIDLFNAIELAFRNAVRKTGSLPQTFDNSDVFCLDDRIFVRTGNARFEKIMLSDINLIEADRSYATIKTSTDNYLLSSSLNRVLEQIDVCFIIRVHKSYAVNIRNITAINDSCLHIGTTHIPLGAGYRDNLMAALKIVK